MNRHEIVLYGKHYSTFVSGYFDKSRARLQIYAKVDVGFLLASKCYKSSQRDQGSKHLLGVAFGFGKDELPAVILRHNDNTDAAERSGLLGPTVAEMPCQVGSKQADSVSQIWPQLVSENLTFSLENHPRNSSGIVALLDHEY